MVEMANINQPHTSNQISERAILLHADFKRIESASLAEFRELAASAGADIIVTGSAVFDGKNPKANAEFMIKALKQ